MSGRRLALTVLALACGLPTSAQVAVGYSSTTSATAGLMRDTVLNTRSRTSFGIAGSNVEPIDGGTVYDERTIWRIRDTSRPSSLILRQDTSVFNAREDDTRTRLVQAARREAVNVDLLGPLSNGVLIRAVPSPFAPLLPINPSNLSTSVFP